MVQRAVRELDNYDFDRELVKLREYRGLSQGQLAKAAEVNISYINRLESGERRPTREMVLKIGQGLNLREGDVRLDRLLQSAGFASVGASARFACEELRKVNNVYSHAGPDSQAFIRFRLTELLQAVAQRMEMEHADPSGL